MKTENSVPAIAVRLTIGKHHMSGFAGLSDGDLFGHVAGGVWQVRNNHYGITLRPVGEPLGKPLGGFVDLPDYFAFVRAVNAAADAATQEAR